MESVIQISKINVFIFCPYSIYYHSLYEKFTESKYHDIPQTVGKIKHENIEEGNYSTSRHILQGTPVYCEKYNLVGKIDIYDTKKCQLIERKYKVNDIYDGYKYQLYAQKFALEEMGNKVKEIFVHSLSDNKRYKIDNPDKGEIIKFESIIRDINKFKVEAGCSYKINEQKCQKCIYAEMCGFYDESA
jgi:CRISPR-associated protein Cas4